MLQTLSMLGRETARIVLHASCVVCDRDLPWRNRKASCCGDCWSSLPVINVAKCDSCALPWSGGGVADNYRCIDCLVDPIGVAWAEAWGYYRGSLERVIHAFKFERHDFFCDPLADLLSELLHKRGDLEFDAIVSVPMHRARIRRRGYNQAELLARSLARRLDLPCTPSLLTRPVEREAQSTLPRAERAKNVRGAFVATSLAAGRSILLIDDVSTTGETIRACAGALLKENASRVCALVVARTEG